MAIHLIHAEIEIDTSAEKVWAVLTDFASYPQWNPLIRSLSGVPQRGARIQITVQPTGGRVMRFSPVILAAQAGRELRWRGHLLLPWVLAGEHSFVIEPLGERRVRFQQSEWYSGVLVRLLRSSLDRDAHRGFEEMNQALKLRSESGDSTEGAR